MSNNLSIKRISQCICCTHPNRELIERLLVSGLSYLDIERQFEDTNHPAPRRSISNHARYHMDTQQTALRRIIEKQAEAAALNVEEATESLITSQAYLKLILERGFEGVVGSNISPEPKDVFKAIELMEKFDAELSAFKQGEMERKFQAFTAAVKSLVDKELWPDILERAKNIFDNDGIDIIDVEEIKEVKEIHEFTTTDSTAREEDSEPEGSEMDLPEPESEV